MALVFALPFAREFFLLEPVPVASLWPVAAASAIAILGMAANRRWGLARASGPESR